MKNMTYIFVLCPEDWSKRVSVFVAPGGNVLPKTESDTDCGEQGNSLNITMTLKL